MFSTSSGPDQDKVKMFQDQIRAGSGLRKQQRGLVLTATLKHKGVKLTGWLFLLSINLAVNIVHANETTHKPPLL